MATPKIITDYWAKPIPPREFDWEAYREGYDGGDWPRPPIGYGATEEAAIADLLDQEEAA